MNNKHLFIGVLIGVIIWSGILVGVQFYPQQEDPTLVLVNQVGYLPWDMNKRVLLQLESLPSANSGEISYRIYFSENGQEYGVDPILTGVMDYRGTLWRRYYYGANISALQTPGYYFVEVHVGQKTYRSYRFEIGPAIYDKTVEAGYQFYYYQRSGCEVLDIIPGYPGHGVCHLDDANPKSDPTNASAWRNLTGGWFDAGDYNKYNGFTMHSIYSLAEIFDQSPEWFSQNGRAALYPNSSYAEHSNMIPDVIEEALWGADFFVKCVNPNGSVIFRVGSNDFHGWYGYWGRPEFESDNDPNTPADNRIFYELAWYPAIGAAGLLKLARLLDHYGWFPEKALKYRDHVSRMATYYNFVDVVSEDLLVLLLEQYRDSGYTNQTYLDRANNVALRLLNSSLITNPGFGHTGVDFLMYALADWAMINGSIDARSRLLGAYEARWTAFWGPLSFGEDDTNIFHLLQGNHSRYGVFYFWSNRFPDTGDWNVGQNSYYAQAAAAAFTAYRWTNDTKYLDFGLRQLDWILGLNPFALCMMEGIGSNNPPTYHNRAQFIPGNFRGAVFGAVCNGIVRLPTDEEKIMPDEPWFDMSRPFLWRGAGDYSSTEPWLPHNAFFLMAAAQIKSS
jgi:hypothetical protein